MSSILINTKNHPHNKYYKVLCEVNIYDFTDYKVYLKAVYDHIKKNTKGFTHKIFSEMFGKNRSNQSASIITGKFPVTIGMANSISDALCWKGRQRKYFLKMVEYTNNTDPDRNASLLNALLDLSRKSKYKKVDSKWLELTSTCYHIPILEMIDTEGFKYDIEWIRENLYMDLRPLQIKKSIELFEELGLIEVKEGKLFKKPGSVDTGPEVKGIEVRAFHTEMINLAQLVLKEVPGHKRDYSSLILNIDNETVQEIKNEIHMFQEKILKIAEKTRCKTQVYSLNFQLFPHTKDLDE